MASKFQQFLSENQIDPRRVLVASRAIERLRPEDRAARLARRQARKAETKPEPGSIPAKPRAGRKVTARLLAQALEGKPIQGPAKTRLLRAVNRVLEQKKKNPTDLRTLF
jgi:hypothetical protein